MTLLLQVSKREQCCPAGRALGRAPALAMTMLLALGGFYTATLTTVALAQEKSATGQKSGSGSTNASLQRRVQQLEEQIIDLQVVIGTLESLAKTGTASHGSGNSGLAVRRSGGGSVDSGRLSGVETQINALTAQVNQLARQVQSIQAQGPRQQGAIGPNSTAGSSTRVAGFGATTVTPGVGDDAIGGLIEQSEGVASKPPGTQTARLPDVAGAPASGETPRQYYEAAYGHLLQQDYAAAQAGFREFLRRFPKDALVPNALYWLGETYYVQHNYADAAEAFDIVTAAYAGSNKAPDSQLKRAMSLANLGKRNEACSAFRSLVSRYPNAPDHVKSKADSESQRVGCS
jgi:tol-pal system protein YbgF